MAVSFDAYSSGYENSTDAEVTVSHTVGSGSNRVLYVIALNHNTADLLVGGTVTYNGVSLGSSIADQLAGTTNKARVWRMIDPPSGTANVVVTATATAYLHVHVISVADADQTTPNGTIASSGSATQTSPVSNTVTLSTGGLAIDVVCRRAAGATMTPGGSQTAMATTLQQGVASSRASRLAGSGSTAMSFTFSATSDVLHLAIPVNEVSGGGGGSSLPLNVITPMQSIAFSSAACRSI